MNDRSKRVFEDLPAVRASVPLLVGLVGPSGSGKTFTALRLATGIQRVTGGDIYVIDTEARRALHYADSFKFRHLELKAPFSPDDYLAAIEHCVTKGAKQIIIDSASLEHEGQGGVLEMHDAELQRMGGQDRHNFPAWAKPKAARRRLLAALTQFHCHFTLCWRAKEKIKPPAKGSGSKDMVELGWMPIAGDEFIFEMTLNALLLPNAGGVPTWQSNLVGERAMIKLPEQFRKQLLESKQPLSEDTGEMLARWAAGGVATGAATAAVKPAGTQPAGKPASPNADTLCFNKSFARGEGVAIESASPEIIAEYIQWLNVIAEDPAKAANKAAVLKHKDAVEELKLRLIAEARIRNGEAA